MKRLYTRTLNECGDCPHHLWGWTSTGGCHECTKRDLRIKYKHNSKGSAIEAAFSTDEADAIVDQWFQTCDLPEISEDGET